MHADIHGLSQSSPRARRSSWRTNRNSRGQPLRAANFRRRAVAFDCRERFRCRADRFTLPRRARRRSFQHQQDRSDAAGAAREPCGVILEGALQALDSRPCGMPAEVTLGLWMAIEEGLDTRTEVSFFGQSKSRRPAVMAMLARALLWSLADVRDMRKVFCL